ncbi:hypothetical protein CDD83_6685 [Cordyceps sp. RAO-2017]|nr:hypothetical protein CDD83_6685 [Cordyceps sp. RAO-2017]
MSIDVPPMETTALKFAVGGYNAIENPDETFAAKAHVSPGTVEVEAGGETSVRVTQGDVEHLGTIKVTIGQIPEFESETFRVVVIKKSSGAMLGDFKSPPDDTTELRRLPSSGTAIISVVDTVLNNVKYSFASQRSRSLLEAVFSNDDMKKDIDCTGFSSCPLK